MSNAAALGIGAFPSARQSRMQGSGWSSAIVTYSFEPRGFFEVVHHIPFSWINPLPLDEICVENSNWMGGG